MHESTAAPSRPRRGILIWAVASTLAALVLGNVALWLWVELHGTKQQLARVKAGMIVQERSSPSPAQRSRSRPSSGETASAASPFATLQDSDVVGRYRLFQEGVDVGVVQLLENHSMINKDGTTFPQYRWEIQPNRLLTRWQAGHIYFDSMPRPGVFVARSRDNEDYRRLEKIEE